MVEASCLRWSGKRAHGAVQDGEHAATTAVQAHRGRDVQARREQRAIVRQRSYRRTG